MVSEHENKTQESRSNSPFVPNATAPVGRTGGETQEPCLLFASDTNRLSRSVLTLFLCTGDEKPANFLSTATDTIWNKSLAGRCSAVFHWEGDKRVCYCQQTAANYQPFPPLFMEFVFILLRF